ncbi:nucleotide disphospho-sugar-binding domain-containing protein [Kutzneria sp. NPDC051319]|uniref:nucleotide disphospho-sugar-binding domain-containing protein n=1 Tax=Kutzneria sp. NPDC051319 TaxID=3155047 RepID=UPI0034178BA5
MTRIAITAVPAPGHFGPMNSIAADLVRRGHHVTVLTGAEFGDAVTATGAMFAPLTGETDRNTAKLVTSAERLAAPPGLPRLQWDLRHLVVGVIADRHHDLCRLLADADDQSTVVLGDGSFYGTTPLSYGAPGPRPAGIIGVGTVHFALSSIDAAPMGMGLPQDTTPAGRERNREANAFLQGEVLGDVQDEFVATMRSLGVTRDPLPFFLDAPILGADRYLQLSIEELSYRRSDTPAHVEFIGTLPAAGRADAARPTWWPDVEAAERVVLVTQGTIANQDFGSLIEPTLAALSDLPVLVVAATGRQGAVRDVPANARIAEYVPFDELLPHTDVLVTNGGFAGVQQALREGTPMVLAGQTEEKLEGNVRVAATGAAINLATDTPAAADIRRAVQAVLTEPGYRDNARRLAVEYATLDPLSSIAKAVEGIATARV